MVQGHAAPVDRQGLLQLGVADSRHLEWEQVVLGVLSQELLALAQVALGRVYFECVIVAQELAVESSNDQDLVICELAHACALSGRDDWLVNLIERLLTDADLGPLDLGDGLEGEDQTLDGVGVLLACVLDAAEDVNKLVLEVAAGVVVSALVDVLELHPLVLIRIIQLDFLGGLTHLFPGAGNHDVGVGDAHARVTMASILHSLLVQELVLVQGAVGVGHKLTALEHAVWE